MSAWNALCAYCVASCVGGHVRKTTTTGRYITSWRDVLSFDPAEDAGYEHISTGDRLPMVAVTLVRGTAACPVHAAALVDTPESVAARPGGFR